MGKPIEITRLDRSASELRELAVKTEDGDMVRRLLGIALLLDGGLAMMPRRPAGWTGRPCAIGCIATTRMASQDFAPFGSADIRPR